MMNELTIAHLFYRALEELMSTIIRGKLYHFDCRPMDSRAEDAVITISALSGEQLQEGVSRINLFVPDVECGGNRLVPDFARLKELAEYASDIIDTLQDAYPYMDIYSDTAPQLIANEDNREHFVSFSINFRTINLL